MNDVAVPPTASARETQERFEALSQRMTRTLNPLPEAMEGQMTHRWSRPKDEEAKAS